MILTPGEIHRLRERVGLSQRQLAKRIGVHRRTVQHWENGRHLPRDYRILYRLGVALAMIDRDQLSNQAGGKWQSN